MIISLNPLELSNFTKFKANRLNSCINIEVCATVFGKNLNYLHRYVFSGIFTAPMDGRYLVTAVLTPEQGEKVDAVLFVSSRSIQRLNSAGFMSGITAPHSHELCNCTSSSSASLILSLRRGDQVRLVLKAGKLAVSASSEVVSSFSAALLYPSTSKR